MYRSLRTRAVVDGAEVDFKVEVMATVVVLPLLEHLRMQVLAPVVLVPADTEDKEAEILAVDAPTVAVNNGNNLHLINCVFFLQCSIKQ